MFAVNVEWNFISHDWKDNLGRKILSENKDSCVGGPFPSHSDVKLGPSQLMGWASLWTWKLSTA